MVDPLPAYEGNDPYEFVSYSHDDRDDIHGEIRWLQDEGFNVWYDAGISGGTEWSEAIARATVVSRVHSSVQQMTCSYLLMTRTLLLGWRCREALINFGCDGYGVVSLTEFNAKVIYQQQ